MNDPKEIAEGLKEVREWHSMVDEALDRRKPAWLKIRSSCLLRALDEFFPAVEQIAAALQAEREDGCRRVNDAIGDRDPIIEQLKAELERVKAERDEAVKAMEPMVRIAKWHKGARHFIDPHCPYEITMDHCNAARAFVERVKQ